jgi:hypothetical protein
VIFGDANDRSKGRQWFHEYQRRAGYFKAKVEDINKVRIRMIDVLLELKNGRIRSSPVWKETSLGVPLCTTSARPAHIHKSWPIQAIKRLGYLSTDKEGANKAKSILIERFRLHSAPPTLIHMLESAEPARRIKKSCGTRPWQQQSCA